MLDLALGYAERAGDLALLRYALQLATDHGFMRPALRACANLPSAPNRHGDYVEALSLIEDGLAIAERSGDRTVIAVLHAHRGPALFALGRWDELFDDRPHMNEWSHENLALTVIAHHARGEAAAAAALIVEALSETEVGEQVVARLLAEAEELFTGLNATPWVQRAHVARDQLASDTSVRL